MCYSFRTSIISYSLGMGSALFAFVTKQYILGSLILVFCQMQLSEALIWKGIDNNNLNLNKTGTLYGQYLLPTHNIAIGIGFLLSLIIVQNKKIQIKDYIPLLIGLIFYIYIVAFPYRKENYPETTFPRNKCKDKSCQIMENRLKWNYPHYWYLIGFIISLLFMIIYVKPVSSKIFIGSIFIVSLLICYLVYPKTVGSVWCFVSAILAPILVLGNWILIRGKNNILT